MKLCFIADSSNIHTKRWLNYFAAKGHEVHLIYWKARPDFDKNIRIHFLKRIAPIIWPITRYISFAQWIIQIRKLVKEIKPDVVDAHFIIDNGLLAALSGFHPFVATAWGSDVLIFPRHNFIWKWVSRFVLRRADRVFYNSEVMKRGLLLLGAVPEKIARVNHGTDIKKFSPQQADESLKQKLGIAGLPTVICIRSLRPLYNVAMFIKAIPLVMEKVPQARFIIAGEGIQRVYLEKLAVKLGVHGSINFLGYISHDDLPSYLATSDVYVSTSRSDSSPQSLQEAMACGLAAVVTDLPANREWITDGENGFIVPQDDHRALAEKIVFLLENSDTRVKFGKINRKIIVEKNDYFKEMAKVEKLYEGLMAGSKSF
jgi:glycosyltransferase involved in cell wall biosynthesis